jgi:uncharacterized membrane protein YgcG
MRGKKPGMAALVAGLGVATAIMGAPLAAADTCDPAITVCQGGEVAPETSSPDYAPPVVASEQYPFDDSWYFDPAGGGTVLQPEHGTNGGGGAHGGGTGGGGGGGGGGHH